MSTLRQNLKWFFVLISVIGTALLVWILFELWTNINERHEIRQRSQIATLASATDTVMASQEMVLDLLGHQLLVDGLAAEPVEAGRLLDRMREINPTVVRYGLASPEGELLAADSAAKDLPPSVLRRQTIDPVAFRAALSSQHMVIGRPFRMASLEGWAVPICKAIRDDDGRLQGLVTAALRLGEPEPLFERQSFLGSRNTVQIVRGSDLYPLHWASEIARPDNYFEHPIPREYYDRAVASAERRSGLTIEEIKASGEPISYRVTNALGPHLGMAVYNPRYDYWVLTQTHRDQLLVEFARAGAVYVVVFLALQAGIFAVLRVIDRAEQRRRRELVHRANHDILTELPNRQRMTADFDEMVQRHPEGVSLLFIDMDNFKAVNDGFGHVQGDALLQQLGARLARFAAREEKVARIGGDEFVLLTPETDFDRLKARAGRLIETLTGPYTVNQVRCELGCSVGIATTEGAGRSLGEMLRAADVAMYAAKRERNAVRVYAPEMGRHYLENIRIEQRLHEAVGNGLIRMEYQPQFDLQGCVIGVEALARWDDDELGAVEPRRFIAIAEASGFVARLGDYIVERCFSDMRAMPAAVRDGLRLSINISVRQFLQPEFAAELMKRASRADLDGLQLVVEITESLFMEDLGQVMGQLHRLREAGVRISLDDFGTGYSSLSLLRSLPVDELKIDKSFIDHLETDPGARRMVQSIIALGRSQDMALVAEGVETREQFEMIRADGCHAVQGFLFARPMVPEALHEWLTAAPRAPVA